jgi:hypothetical protein
MIGSQPASTNRAADPKNLPYTSVDPIETLNPSG